MCDDWFVVDESDGKVERIFYLVFKKELMKFNVFFVFEVRKNFIDGYIWFFVVVCLLRSIFMCV